MDVVSTRFEIGNPLRDINNLSVGDNIVTTISKAINDRGRWWLIVPGAM